MAFTVDSTTDEVVEGLDLSNIVAIITGASGGLGAETARALASKGATVVLVARNSKKLADKAEALKQLTGNDKIHTQIMDLMDLESVRQASTELLTRFPAVNLLINNAGIMACPLARTVQGFESQIGVNHIAHFVFTQALLPALKGNAPARVVTLTSAAHKLADVNLADINWEAREYEKWAAYGEAKTANALFSTALQASLKGTGVTSNCVHPGVIMTDLARSLTEQDFAAIVDPNMTIKSVAAGAATTVWAAVSPQLEGRGGMYLEDCQPGVEMAGDNMLAGYSAYALDLESAEKLWQKTQQLIRT